MLKFIKNMYTFCLNAAWVLKGLYLYLNTCAAELFVSTFHSYQPGIADAISSLK